MFRSPEQAVATGDVTGALPGTLSFNPAADYEKASAYIGLMTAVTRADAAAANTYLLLGTTSATAGNAGAGNSALYLDPVSYPAGTKTLYLRCTLLVMTNNTAPVSTFTLGLYPLTAPAGGAATVSVTIGTVTAGSTAVVTTPAANTITYVAGSDFAFPTAGVYALAMLVTGSMVANSSATWRAMLQRRAV